MNFKRVMTTQAFPTHRFHSRHAAGRRSLFPPLALLSVLAGMIIAQGQPAKPAVQVEVPKRMERITARPNPTNDAPVTNAVAATNATATATGAPTNSGPRIAVPRTAGLPSSIPPGLVPPRPQGPGATTQGPVTATTPGAAPVNPNVMAAPATGGDATAANADSDDMVKLLNFNNAPVDQVLEYYSELTGRTVLRPANLAGSVTIKAQGELNRSEALQALNSVLALNGITMINVGSKFVKAVLQAQALQEAAAFSKHKADDLPEADSYITQIVELKNAKPSEVVPTLVPFAKNQAGIVGIDSSQIIVLRDYASNVKRMLELIEKVDVVPELDYKLEVIPINYGKVEDIYTAINGLISGQGATTGGTSRTPTRSSSASRFGTAALQAQRQPNQPAQAVTPNQNSFQNRLNQLVSRAAQGSGDNQLLADAKIYPDERANKLYVFANKQDYQMITNIVAKVDVPLAQVLIEAIVMEVSLDNTRQLGVSYLQKPHSTGQFTGAGGYNNGQSFLDPRNFLTGATSNAASSAVTIPSLPGGMSYFGTFGNNFDVAMQALSSDSTVNVISRPRIQTSHAIPGSFFVGNTVPYITGTSYGYGAADLYGGNRSSYTQLSVGIQLDVTPFITPDGLVVMEIQQNIEQLGPDKKIDNNDVPTTVRRQASATISVRDRDTIMLGGYINSDTTKARSGVPFLKDIPLFGALFRSSTDSHRRTELVVLMRPTVLQKPEQAAIFAREEIQRLPGVSQAQAENERAEAKRRADYQKELLKEEKKNK